jgi:DNA replication protein DnaC
MSDHLVLAPFARRLRLQGIFNTLDMRVQEAREADLGYIEFLQTVLSDEVERRDNQYIAQLQRKSGLNPKKTLESYDWTYNNHEKRYFRDLATCSFVDEKAPAIIVGPNGVGKSHLAQAVGNQAIRQGRSVTFVSQADLLERLANARITGAYKNTLGRLSKVDLLIIDDLGLTPLGEESAEDLYRLVLNRYEEHSTMITSNLHYSEWTGAFENRCLANAIIDRLKDRAHVAVLTGKSYRRPETQFGTDGAKGG